MGNVNPVGSVAEFMRSGGQHVPASPGFPEDLDVRDLHIELVREEFYETLEASLDNDLAGTIDGYADLAIVALSGLIAHAGESAANAVMHEVMRANLDKVLGDPVRDSNGKITKPKGWEAPAIDPIISDHIDEGFESVTTAIDPDDTTYRAILVQYSDGDQALILQVDFNDVTFRVAHSNDELLDLADALIDDFPDHAYVIDKLMAETDPDFAYYLADGRSITVDGLVLTAYNEDGSTAMSFKFDSLFDLVVLSAEIALEVEGADDGAARAFEQVYYHAQAQRI